MTASSNARSRASAARPSRPSTPCPHPGRRCAPSCPRPVGRAWPQQQRVLEPVEPVEVPVRVFSVRVILVRVFSVRVFATPTRPLRRGAVQAVVRAPADLARRRRWLRCGIVPGRGWPCPRAPRRSPRPSHPRPPRRGRTAGRRRGPHRPSTGPFPCTTRVLLPMTWRAVRPERWPPSRTAAAVLHAVHERDHTVMTCPSCAAPMSCPGATAPRSGRGSASWRRFTSRSPPRPAPRRAAPPRRACAVSEEHESSRRRPA